MARTLKYEKNTEFNAVIVSQERGPKCMILEAELKYNNLIL